MKRSRPSPQVSVAVVCQGAVVGVAISSGRDGVGGSSSSSSSSCSSCCSCCGGSSSSSAIGDTFSLVDETQHKPTHYVLFTKYFTPHIIHRISHIYSIHHTYYTPHIIHAILYTTHINTTHIIHHTHHTPHTTHTILRTTHHTPHIIYDTGE